MTWGIITIFLFTTFDASRVRPVQSFACTILLGDFPFGSCPNLRHDRGGGRGVGTKNVRTTQPTWVSAGSKFVRIPTDLGQNPSKIRSDGPTDLPTHFRGSCADYRDERRISPGHREIDGTAWWLHRSVSPCAGLPCRDADCRPEGVPITLRRIKDYFRALGVSPSFRMLNFDNFSSQDRAGFSVH